MPKVNHTRDEYDSLLPDWEKIRDCIAGERQVKEKGGEYLPRPNASDTSDENKKRFDSYLQRAVFYNVTGRTHKGLIGQVFAKEPAFVLPDLMKSLPDDIDGGGMTLEQQAKKALGHSIAYGRAGILVDFPKNDKATSRAELMAGKVRPTVTLFDPWDIINWRESFVNGKKLLTLIVLSESEVVNDDGFKQENEDYFRVLRLVDGVYFSQVWYWDETLNDFVMEEEVMPLNGAGRPWEFIPFNFIGAENNTALPSLPPLKDLADLNIAHYRNSADYEEACFIVGQPTPVFTGLTKEWVDDVLKGEVQLGSRAAIALPVGGEGKLLQAVENSMSKEAMEMKEEQMKAIGAKLIEPGTVQKTATEAGIEEASSTSVLSSCAKCVSAAYTNALKWCAQFLNQADDEIYYELNTEFSVGMMSPAARQQLIAEWQANAISKEEMRDGLKRAGVAWQTMEEFEAAVDAAGIDLGVPVGSAASAAAKAAEDAAKAKAEAAKNKPAPTA